ncbi:MAG TPA: M50 family metallopeptidase, partial [Coriobacteriia bacterium]
KKSGVRYGVTALPLGGYVRIAGMEPGAEDLLLADALAFACAKRHVHEPDVAVHLSVPRDHAARLLATLSDWGAITPDEDGHGFHAAADLPTDLTPSELLDRARSVTYRGKKTWQRIVILSMGVLLNLLTAILIFTVTLSIWGYEVASLNIGSVQKGSAAESAGLLVGDRMVSIDGKAITDWNEVPATIRALKPDAPVRIVVDRGGARVAVRAMLGWSDGHSFLGVGPGREQKRFTVVGAFLESLRWTGLVFAAIGAFFDPATFSASLKGARSVVGISYEVARAAQAGPVDYAWMIAFLSLSLGVMNILPVPPLDGGKIAMEIVERVLRRPLRREFSYAASAVGAVLLFSLIFYLMYADIMRYIVKS